MNMLFNFSWRDFTELAALVVLILGAVWVVIKPRIEAGFVSKGDYAEDIAEVNTRLTHFEQTVKASGLSHDARLSRVELQLDGLPDKDSFHKLSLDLKEQAGDLKEIRANVKPLSSAVQRIEDHLLKGR